MVNGPEDEVFDWAATNWRAVEDDVRRLRQRIFTASQAGISARQPALGACLSRMHGNVHVRLYVQSLVMLRTLLFFAILVV